MMILEASKSPSWLKALVCALNAILLCYAPLALMSLPSLIFAGQFKGLFVHGSIVAYALIRTCIWSVQCWTENPAPQQRDLPGND